MKKSVFITLLGILLLVFNKSLAEETKARRFQGIDCLTGFGWAKLNGEEKYRLFPFLVDFNFNLKPLFNQNPPQLMQFQLEPFISYVAKPENNIEAGTSFLFKTGIFPETWQLQPYIKVGLGMVYMTQHTREQSTQFNFTEQGCAGLHYFFRKSTALTFEYRFRHLSNCGIKSPNHGINTKFVVGGLTLQF